MAGIVDGHPGQSVIQGFLLRREPMLAMFSACHLKFQFLDKGPESILIFFFKLCVYLSVSGLCCCVCELSLAVASGAAPCCHAWASRVFLVADHRL